MSTRDRLPATNLRVPASHPSLPGHFPGNPIVPGVLVLSLTIDALKKEFGPFRVAAISKVRFLETLLAEQVFTVEGEKRGTGSLHFRCLRGGDLIANGVLVIEPLAASPSQASR